MNSTKLGIFCDKVLEMGWLLAVIITPLLFNVYSSRVFEPDKLTTLRTVALIMGAVWAVKWIEERVSGRREMDVTWRTPLVLPTLFMVIIYVLSTLLSVTPYVSLLGSYQRLQGTYTTLAYIVVFLVVLQGMRTREQLDRLITVVILNSLPIALYGLIQRNKLDPLPWGGDVTRRVASNMGNAIFVAAYLIMATPATLARIVTSFRSILNDEESVWSDIFRAAVYIFILLVQLVATFYTQSRGPLMGLLAGLGIWGFLGLLTLLRTAHRENPPQPDDLPWDLLKGLGFGLASLAVAGGVGFLLFVVTGLLVTLVGGTTAWIVIGGGLALALLGVFLGVQVSGWPGRLGWVLLGVGGVGSILQFVAMLFGGENLAAMVAALGVVLVLLGIWMVFIINRWGWRWMWASALILAAFASAGFFAVNPGGPLNDWARGQPSLRRITNVLEPGSGTGMVRNLIWQGGVKLFLPHDPIEYPPTSEYPEGRTDSYNALRPVMGYGPESMYVAYNPFYPPLLGHYESRTASPDRSHNETLDSLIITGVLGFVAYLWVFGSVFYFGLRWLGFLPTDWRRIVFFVLLVLGAVAAMAIVIPMVGPHFFCLAIPIGIVGGLFVYLVVWCFSLYWDTEHDTPAHPATILLIGLLAAVVAHFVEINFGIAIASTRTTFWAYAGAFVVAGLGLIRTSSEQVPEETQTRESKRSRRRRKRYANKSSATASSEIPTWLWSVLAISIIGGFFLGTLSFDFVTNAERLTEPLRIVWRALTVLPAQQSRTSYGALMIFAVTWVMSGVIFITEMSARGAFRAKKGDGLLAITVYWLVSFVVGFGMALVLASKQAGLMRIQAQTLEDVLGIADQVAGFLTTYYWYILFVLLTGGGVLFLESKARRRMRIVAQPWGVIALIVLTVVVGALATVTNLQPIKADVIYKQADPYDRGKQWLVAIEHYKHAIELVPKEDFYYLYLGRAYLEYASSLEDPEVRDAVMRETEDTLLQAREINPLNTDHSANLARMYRRWADFTSDEERRLDLLRKSSENYEIATTLSPQNAILWNEWAMLYYYSLGDVESYERTLDHSLELDPEFDQTWLVCGDANRQQGKLEEAAHCYEEALAISPKNSQVWRALGDTYIAAEEWTDAINALTHTVELRPNANDVWNIHQVIARLYSQLGDAEQALFHAQMALEAAPEDQQGMLQDLVAQIENLVESP